MEIEEIGRYNLSFDANRFTVRCPRGTDRFSGLATSNLPKIYIVSVGGEPIYVGKATLPIRERLRQGWAATGKNGYHGYAWRHAFSEAHLDIWCHRDPTKQRGCLDMETIEAEVVYLIRQAGQWPRFQTEIHFHESSDEHRRWASLIAAKYLLAAREVIERVADLSMEGQ